ncbi:MAG: SdpI family protein [Sulfuricaulis sp.]
MAHQTVLLLMASGVMAVVALPLILQWVPPNGLCGFRTPRTLADRDLWYRANTFCGWAILLAAFASIILLVILPSSQLAVLEFASPLIVAIVASLLYVRRAA